MKTATDDQTPLRKERVAERRGQISLAARMVFLVVVFLAVPIVLYRVFERADEDKRQLLIDSVYERGRLTMEVLRNKLEAGGLEALPSVSDQLQVLGTEDTVLRLLYKPNNTEGDSFFYVAAAPSRSAEELTAERQEMESLGVFERLSASCMDGKPRTTRQPLGQSREEVVIAVTPLLTHAGCWTLVTSFSTAAVKDSSIGRPYWETPEIRLGAVIYLAMFMVTLTVMGSIWRGLKRLSQRARQIRTQGPSHHRFVDIGGPDEVVEVAQELDRLVATLNTSAQILRQISAENAHAFKTPVAVIRQSVEPIKRRVEEPRLVRAVEMIELSLEKLDALIASAWRVDELMADLMHPPRERVDLSSLITRVGHDYATMSQARRVTVLSSVDPGVAVLGSLDLLEAITENLMDNAVSFTPSGGQVRLTLEAEKDMAVLTVTDDGPGVADHMLEKIFDRYFTTRGETGHQAEQNHLGLGLWIVRRNVEALGGSITARNRTEGGLKMIVRLPLAS